MPQAAPRPCTYPGCGALVRDGSGRCAQHPAPTWTKRPDSPKRITGRKLQRARRRLFEREPLCVECRKRGIVRLATQRDHEIPVAEGGADDESNEQGLCDDCHAEKSRAERLRGLARSRGG